MNSQLFKVGARVLVRRTEGAEPELATIVKRYAGGTYEVLYDTGQHASLREAQMKEAS
jgi:hypothetical protein